MRVQITDREKDTASGWTLFEEDVGPSDSLENFFDADCCFDVYHFEVSETSSEGPESLQENCQLRVSSMSIPSLSCSSVSSGSLSSTENESSTPLSRTKRISFGQVSVHQHTVTIGDNPSCSHGPPVSLDWTLLRSDSYNLDEYEAMLESSRGKVKRLGRLERETLLQESGYSMHALARVTEQVDHEKVIRTVQKMQLNAMEEYQVMAAASVRRLRRTNDPLTISTPSRSQTNSDGKVKRIARFSSFMRNRHNNATPAA